MAGEQEKQKRAGAELMTSRCASKRARSFSPRSATAGDGADKCEVLSMFLGGIVSEGEFFETYWEKRHLHIPFASRRQESLRDVNWPPAFTFKDLETMVTSHDLSYASDLNVCRVRDGIKVMFNKSGLAAWSDVSSLFTEEKCTVQFMQPQRYSEELWGVCADLEKRFGSLCGANCYLTPAAAQGLAPHFDDVEVFVVQTQGRKRWRIFAPAESHMRLEMESSGDLAPNEYGECILDVVLETGDVLYFPRGTVHVAQTLDDQLSTHITFSTYQRHNFYEFLSLAMPRIMDAAVSRSIALKSGIPLRSFEHFGSLPLSTFGSETDAQHRCRKHVASILRDLAAKVEQGSDGMNEAVNESFDELSIDFMTNRLPPYPRGSKSSLSPLKQVRLAHPSYMRAIVMSREVEEEEEEQEEEEEEEEHYLRVFHCLKNCQTTHMGTPIPNPSSPPFFDLPMECENFVSLLFRSWPKSIKVPQKDSFAEEAIEELLKRNLVVRV